MEVIFDSFLYIYNEISTYVLMMSWGHREIELWIIF